MVYTLRFFFSSKCSLFHNSNVFGSCIIHILYTGVLKLKKNNSGAKRLNHTAAILISLPNSPITSITFLFLSSLGSSANTSPFRKKLTTTAVINLVLKLVIRLESAAVVPKYRVGQNILRTFSRAL